MKIVIALLVASLATSCGGTFFEDEDTYPQPNLTAQPPEPIKPKCRSLIVTCNEQ